MSEFKIGDVVVVVKSEERRVGYIILGEPYVVESVIVPSAANKYWTNQGYTIGIRTSMKSVHQVHPDMLVHESVYNSPLYKALT